MARPEQPVLDKVNLGGWEVTEDYLRDYLAAVGDEIPAYFQHGLVPAVALAARALGSLLERLELPPGAIHSLQEIDTLRPVSIGQTVNGTATVGSPRRRGDMEFIAVGFTLKDGDGREILEGKSTVLVVEPSPPSSSEGNQDPGERPGRSNTTTSEAPEETTDSSKDILPRIVKTINQAQLRAYAQVSGDWNPLHLDPEFAATTQFGGIIAHGMLTLAFISEMMTTAFEQAWLETGALRVRFKGAAYLGDRVETWGRVTKGEPHSEGIKIGCAVGVANAASGQELISGTANLVRG